MSTVEQIAKDIRKAPSYVTEALVQHLYTMGYSKSGHVSHEAIRLDILTHEGEFTPDHVAEYLHSLGYSKDPRMTEAEVQAAFDRGTARWRDEARPADGKLCRYWAEELGVKVISGTRIQGGV